MRRRLEGYAMVSAAMLLVGSTVVASKSGLCIKGWRAWIKPLIRLRVLVADAETPRSEGPRPP
jgi:hypothetical protein